MSAKVTVGIVDYGMGNRRSVEKALEHVGATVLLTSDADRLRRADGIVVPGVGAFPQGMANLGELGLDALIRELARAGRPVLGICLGMQLLFEHSEEIGGSEGLGLIAGQVTRLQSGGLRVPHIGWNEVRFEQSSPLTAGLPSGGCPFYHVHSFAARPAEAGHVVGTTAYGERFATIVARANIFGVQFHPEKSSHDGLRLLGNFVRISGAGGGDPSAISVEPAGSASS
ncbi:MAG TPA: imidazole glycerol phosphate synthase subunit HisH [Solirubrobacteraceae bacterium]|nr:imidazole glycerol phosphate synthase subunit HisH [Solirubrobacteraceae bacterium]